LLHDIIDATIESRFTPGLCKFSTTGYSTSDYLVLDPDCMARLCTAPAAGSPHAEFHAHGFAWARKARFVRLGIDTYPLPASPNS